MGVRKLFIFRVKVMSKLCVLVGISYRIAVWYFGSRKPFVLLVSHNIIIFGEIEKNHVCRRGR